MAALLGFPRVVFWPGGLSPAVTNFTLNQSTDALEVIFQAPEDGAITRVGLRQGTAAGTVPAFKASLQGVDGGGNPDGNIKGAGLGTPASVVWTPSAANDNTWYWLTLDNAYTPTARGEMLALVVARDSGTIDGSNNCSFAVTSDIVANPGIPYAIQNDNGSRARQVASPLFGFGTSAQAYGIPASNAASGTIPFSSTSNPDERGVLFNLPATLLSTYKVAGAVISGTLAAGNTFDLALYDSDGSTVLAQKTFDMDHDRNASIPRARPFYFDDSPATLQAGQGYRLTVLPSATALVLNRLTVAADADMDAYPWGGAIARSTARTDGGAWTDDVKQRYAVDLILSDITPPTGGGTTYFFPAE